MTGCSFIKSLRIRLGYLSYSGRKLKPKASLLFYLSLPGEDIGTRFRYSQTLTQSPYPRTTYRLQPPTLTRPPPFKKTQTRVPTNQGAAHNWLRHSHTHTVTWSRTKRAEEGDCEAIESNAACRRIAHRTDINCRILRSIAPPKSAFINVCYYCYLALTNQTKTL